MSYRIFGDGTRIELQVRMASRTLLFVLAGFLVLASAPVPADANLVCPGCEIDPAAELSTARLVELVLATLLRQGVAVLLAGAAFVVGVPWALAGFAVALLGPTERS